MGLFGGIKQRWKDGSLMNGLQAAGAMAHGDYGSAAEILALHRRALQQAQARPQPRAAAAGGWLDLAQQPGQPLGATAQAQAITPEEAARVRQLLGMSGHAAFERWLRDNNLVIGAR